MKFSNYLTSLRERKRITKKDLAAKLDVTSQYIVNIEKGHSDPPTLERLEQISTALSLIESERKKLFELAYEERQSENDIAFQQAVGGSSPRPAQINDVKIPVVSMARGDDMDGFQFEQLEPHEYEYIDFEGCLGTRVMSNSMAPVVYAGQQFIYDPNMCPQDGDLSYVKKKTGEEYVKRFKRDVKRKLIILESVNTIGHGTIILEEKEVEFMYCVVGACYRIRKRNGRK